jgi:cytochrome c-type biogenesis protein CcmH/NrfG
MSVRFCPRCGTRATPQAKFCTECGAALAGKAAPVTGGRWQFSAAGAVVLGGFVAAGLAIWTAILSPAPPKPGVGAPRPAAGPGASAPAVGLPEGHPQVTLPEEAKKFITDLAAQAKEKPDDVQTWMKLAQVSLRAAQVDPAYFAGAASAFRRVLALEPHNPEALLGIANVHYDRNEAKEAIPYYERYLGLRPDDPSARTDLGTMYLYGGDAARAIGTYKDVLERTPSFLQAHYNLAITYHRRGDAEAARAELEAARRLATDDTVRKQIDDMIASLSGGARPGAPQPGDGRDVARPEGRRGGAAWQPDPRLAHRARRVERGGRRARGGAGLPHGRDARRGARPVQEPHLRAAPGGRRREPGRRAGAARGRGRVVGACDGDGHAVGGRRTSLPRRAPGARLRPAVGLPCRMDA